MWTSFADTATVVVSVSVQLCVYVFKFKAFFLSFLGACVFNFVSQDDFMGNFMRYSLQLFLLCLLVDFLDRFLERLQVHVLFTPSIPSRGQRCLC